MTQDNNQYQLTTRINMETKLTLAELTTALRELALAQDSNTETNVVEVRIHTDPGSLWRTLRLVTEEEQILQTETDRLADRISELTDERDALDGENEDNTQRYKRAESEVEDLSGEIARLKGELDDANNRIYDLESELEEANARSR